MLLKTPRRKISRKPTANCKISTLFFRLKLRLTLLFPYSALKWHPDRVTQDKQAEAQSKFQEIGEAFDILSDAQKKKIYDSYGEEAVKGGIPADDTNGPQFHFQSSMPSGCRPNSGNFRFSQNNAEDIFRAFFGTSDPFQADVGDEFFSPSGSHSSSSGGGSGGGGGFGTGIGGAFPFMMPGGGIPGGFAGGMGGAPGGAFGRTTSMGGGHGFPSSNYRHSMPSASSSSSQVQPERKADPVHYPLKVTLEDLFTGKIKKVRISKKTMDKTTGHIVVATVDKEIPIKAGWKDGTKITFEREGDELPGIIPADIIFTVTTKPHDRFERVNDDLIHTHTISLHEALTGVRFTLPSLDNREISVEARHVTPDTIKIIPGEGMPNSKTKIRGDLRVKFHILFPDLSDSERHQIAGILRNSTSSDYSSSSRFGHK